MTLFSLAGSPDHASHTAQQESDLERKMTATSGRKCLEQFERFNRVGLWAKTFAGLLIGMEGWYSTKCSLIWKMKATKSSRFYFQLAPLTRPTDGIGFGLLLKTPTKFDSTVSSPKANPVSGNSGCLAQELMCGFRMLPTPTKIQRDHPERVEALKVSGAATMASRNCGGNRPNSILDAVNFYGMLPPPAKRDTKGANSLEHLNRETDGNSHQDQLPNFIKLATGSSSQLNPRFVAEMMGFPPDWTELPFQSGESLVSEPTETP